MKLLQWLLIIFLLMDYMGRDSLGIDLTIFL